MCAEEPKHGVEGCLGGVTDVLLPVVPPDSPAMQHVRILPVQTLLAKTHHAVKEKIRKVPDQLINKQKLSSLHKEERRFAILFCLFLFSLTNLGVKLRNE